MLSAYQLDIVCYIGEPHDGAVLCPECWTCESPAQERAAAVCRYSAESAFPEGLTCDGCMKEIVEISPEETER